MLSNASLPAANNITVLSTLRRRKEKEKKKKTMSFYSVFSWFRNKE